MLTSEYLSRRAGFSIAGVAAILTLAGCASFSQAPTGNQANAIGFVHIQTQICLNGFTNDEYQEGYNFASINADAASTGTLTGPSDPQNCDRYGDSGQPDGQLLIGYMIPNGSVSPATITSPNLPGVTFAQDQQYSDYLNSSSGPDNVPGETWTGYISSEIDDASFQQDINFDVAFPLPTNTDGTPYQGPFSTQEVVGDRLVGTLSDSSSGNNYTADRDLNCSETDTTGTGSIFGDENTSTTNCNEDTGQVSIPVNDLTVTAPQTVTAQQGASVILPFNVNFSGASDPTETFSLAGSTDITGTSATSENNSITPTTDSVTPENVDISIPSTLAPGVYHVTLTAADSAANVCSDASQCTRTGTATINVVAAPTAAPGPIAPGPIDNPGPPSAPPVVIAPAPISPAPTPSPVTLSTLRDKLIHMTHQRIGGLFTQGELVKFSCNQACTAHLRLFVYYRAEYRGLKYRFKLREDMATTHPPKTWKATVATTIVNLPQAGTRTVRIHLQHIPQFDVGRAGGIILGSQLYAVDVRGQQHTKLQQLKVQAPGPHYLVEIYNRDKRLGIPFHP